jgi:hypothetical protein
MDGMGIARWIPLVTGRIMGTCVAIMHTLVKVNIPYSLSHRVSQLAHLTPNRLVISHILWVEPETSRMDA